MSLQHLLSPADEAPPTTTVRPYAPTKRVTPPSSVLIPISRIELAQLSQLTNNPLRRGNNRAPPIDSRQGPAAPSTSNLPPKPVGLPQRPHQGNGNGYKRSGEYMGHQDGVHPPQKRARPNQDTSVVANHCQSSFSLALVLFDSFPSLTPISLPDS